MPDMVKRNTKPKGLEARRSSVDPTAAYNASGRARGISNLSLGSGPTAGYLFALSNDSLVHTYDAASLEPFSGRSTNQEADPWSYGHANMRTGSFYVRSAVSPCGRWLASGGAEKGSVFLFDVSGSTTSRLSGHPSDLARRRGVQLHGQSGEVGVVDWANDMLATCSDDGIVRVWRPDIERYRQCQADPEQSRWNWKWTASDVGSCGFDIA